MWAKNYNYFEISKIIIVKIVRNTEMKVLTD